jgi:hypothetical protein
MAVIKKHELWLVCNMCLTEEMYCGRLDVSYHGSGTGFKTRNSRKNIFIMRNYYSQNDMKNLTREVLVVVIMQIIVGRDVTHCSPVDNYRRFGGIFYLHLQSRKAKEQLTL